MHRDLADVRRRLGESGATARAARAVAAAQLQLTADWPGQDGPGQLAYLLS